MSVPIMIVQDAADAFRNETLARDFILSYITLLNSPSIPKGVSRSLCHSLHDALFWPITFRGVETNLHTLFTRSVENWTFEALSDLSAQWAAELNEEPNIP